MNNVCVSKQDARQLINSEQDNTDLVVKHVDNYRIVKDKVGYHLQQYHGIHHQWITIDQYFPMYILAYRALLHERNTPRIVEYHSG